MCNDHSSTLLNAFLLHPIPDRKPKTAFIKERIQEKASDNFYNPRTGFIGWEQIDTVF